MTRIQLLPFVIAVAACSGARPTAPAPAQPEVHPPRVSVQLQSQDGTALDPEYATHVASQLGGRLEGTAGTHWERDVYFVIRRDGTLAPQFLEDTSDAFRSRVARQLACPRCSSLIPPAGAGDSVSLAAHFVADPADPPLRWVSPAGDTARYPLEVDQRAMLAPRNPQPIYPSDAWKAGRGGVVLAELVVDAKGDPVAETIRVLEASDRSFADAVTRVARRMRWIPARVSGHPVPQVIQLPVVFEVAGGPSVQGAFPEPAIVITAMGAR